MLSADSPAEPTVVVVAEAPWGESLASALERGLDATVHRTAAAADATDRCDRDAVDCVVCDYHLADGTALDLLASPAAPDCPVVVCSAAGSERIASDCIRAGATDYVPFSWLWPSYPELLDRIEAAIAEGAARAALRHRARAFEATFETDGGATWVLDGDGRVERANDRARRLLAGPAEVRGERFEDLACWDSVRDDVRQLVDRAARRQLPDRLVTELATTDGGTASEATDRVTEPGTGDGVTAPGATDRVLELSVLPVTADGALRGLVVEADDITERVSVYRELRASEALHRVVLNNMTDTVLVTDDDGEFTYICPNVHFIFGYTVEEIHDLGTIDELLGPDLFDRDELAAEGVLTNIECTTADRAGIEHTLLVNVREVDIQGGTMLFSCRDVTKRKQRERALTTLQETTRTLLYAESDAEIAQLLVDESAEILDLPAAAIYLYDTDANELRPTAYTDAFVTNHGPLDSLPADRDSFVGRAFLSEAPAFETAVGAGGSGAGGSGAGGSEAGGSRRTESGEPPATDLGSLAGVPLGDHGVLVAGSPDPDAFESIHRELTDLLGATAEAALDRVERDHKLREQDRTLQRQNAQLTQLNEVNELIRDIVRVLVRAETRAEVDRTVCEVLADSPHFAFAWIGDEDGGQGLEARVAAGEGRGYLEAIDLGGAATAGDSTGTDPDDSASAVEPAVRAATTGKPVVVDSVAEDIRRGGWHTEALSRGFQSVVSVPLVYDDFDHGVLTVYAEAPGLFEGTTSEVLAELGEMVAATSSAIRRKQALLTSTGTRLTFETDDPDFVLSQLAREADATLTFEGGVQQTESGSVVLLSVDGDVADVVAAAERSLAVASVEVLGEEPDVVLKVALDRPFIAQKLADHGAVLRSVEARPRGARLVVDVPSSLDSQPVVDHVRESLDGAELVAKLTREELSPRDLSRSLLDELTDRQLEVVRTAFEAGYFETPNERSGQDIADMLEISPQAFYNHVERVEQLLFATLFGDGGVRSDDGS